MYIILVCELPILCWLPVIIPEPPDQCTPTDHYSLLIITVTLITIPGTPGPVVIIYLVCPRL